MISMGIIAGSITGGGGDSDPYWDEVSSLLHFDGPLESTSFIDATGRTWTRAGLPYIDTAISVFGGASGKFNGYREYIYSTAGTGFDFGSGDFTIEGFARLATATGSDQYPCVISARQGINYGYAFNLVANASGAGFSFEMSSNGTSTGVSVSTSITILGGVWYYVAISRVGNSLYLFIDGVLRGTADVTGFVMASPPTYVCYGTLTYDLFPDQNYWNGHLDEWRITKGVGRYSSSFTPPSAAFPSE